MNFFMSSFREPCYALMRIFTGLLFLVHGSQKLFGIPMDAPDAPAFILYVAGPIEFVGGFLVMIGWFAAPAAFVCSGLMAFAYWMAHGMNHAIPHLNGGELAALYCFVFLFLSSRGAGIWSVDGNGN